MNDAMLVVGMDYSGALSNHSDAYIGTGGGPQLVPKKVRGVLSMTGQATQAT